MVGAWVRGHDADGMTEFAKPPQVRLVCPGLMRLLIPACGYGSWRNEVIVSRAAPRVCHGGRTFLPSK